MRDPKAAEPPEIWKCLEAMNPSTNLFYNYQTHKVQYHHEKLMEFQSLEQRHRTRNEPIFKAVSTVQANHHTPVYGQIVSEGLQRQFRKDSIAERSREITGNGTVDKDSEYSRKDSVISNIAQKLSETNPSRRASSSTSLFAKDISEAQKKKMLTKLRTHTTVGFDLRLKSNVASLSSFFASSAPQLGNLKYLERVIIRHNVVECADREELAQPKSATTTFVANDDGSVSISTSFEMDDRLSCVCDVERTFEALLRGGSRARERPIFKIKPWPKPCTTPKPEQEIRRHTIAGEWASDVMGQDWTPAAQISWTLKNRVIALVNRFIELLHPQAGSDPTDSSTVYGLESFERPVCKRRQASVGAGNGCQKDDFQISGLVEGTVVKISGQGEHERKEYNRLHRDSYSTS